MVGRHKKNESPYIARAASLGRILKERRRDVLNISRRELSLRSGISASSIQAIEEGRTVEPGLFTVIALAVALGLDLGDMMRSVTGPIRPTLLHAPEARARAAGSGG